MAEHEKFNVQEVAAWRKEVAKAKEDVKEISDLGYILQKNTEGLSKAQIKTNKNLGDALDISIEAAKKGKMNLAQLKRRKDLIGKIANEEFTLESTKAEQRKLDLEILKIQRRYTGGNKEKGKQLIREIQKDKQLLKIEQSRLQTQSNIAKAQEAGMTSADKVLDGMGGKIKGFITNPLTAAIALLLAFNSQTEAIANQFGAIGVTDFRKDLSKANKEAKKLGFSGAESNKAISDLANNFGLSVTEASKLSKIAAETAKATGMTLDDAGKLIGVFTQTQGLTGEQANELIRSTQALAKANDVAPDKVLADVAANTEQFAQFSKDGGKNILRAAIQARKLGISLTEVAKTADSLLNFQDSLTKEIEASTLIGRQLNLQKARELALAGDLEGVQSEILKQVGSEAEFNEMNALQRQALADAVGLQNSELQKLVSAEKDAVSLQGELAKQNIDEIVSDKAITATAGLIKDLKVMGMQLAETVGPAVNLVVQAVGLLAKGLEKVGGLMPLMIGYFTVLTAKLIMNRLATESSMLANLRSMNIKKAFMGLSVVENFQLGLNTSLKKGNTVAEIAKQATEKGGIAQLSILLGMLYSSTAALVMNTIAKYKGAAADNVSAGAAAKSTAMTKKSTAANVANAIAKFFNASASGSAVTLGFGTLALVAIAAAAVGAMMMSMASAKSVGDMHMGANGGPIVTTPQGQRYEGSIRDEVLMAPNIAGAGGGGTDTSKLESKQNQTNDKLERVAAVLEGALSGPKPALARAMGTSVGDSVGEMA